jgi:hypothetical protein
MARSFTHSLPQFPPKEQGEQKPRGPENQTFFKKSVANPNLDCLEALGPRIILESRTFQILER